MIYTCYIFDRNGNCLYHRDWYDRGNRSDKVIEHERKNLFGVLFSMKSFVNNLTPYARGEFENEVFRSYTTSQYKLHYYETVSGLRFVLLTDPKLPSMTDTLKDIFRIYVDTVVNNPFHVPNEGAPIQVPEFELGLSNLVRSLPYFAGTDAS